MQRVFDVESGRVETICDSDFADLRDGRQPPRRRSVTFATQAEAESYLRALECAGRTMKTESGKWAVSYCEAR